MSVGFAYNENSSRHFGPAKHPENANRIDYCWKYISESGLLSKLTLVKPTDIDLNIGKIAHSEAYIEKLKSLQEYFEENEESVVATKSKKYFFPFTKDTYITKDSFIVASEALSNCISLLDGIYNNTIKYGFALIRPPGHHAGMEYTHGFCLLNNIAITAKLAQQKYHASKIVIFDFDVHHGDGTQDIILKNSSNVCFISFHRYGNNFFPQTGDDYYIQNDNNSACVNIPLLKGYNNDTIKYLFNSVVLPILIKTQPELILISSGFDAVKNDPIGECFLTCNVYNWLTQKLKIFCDNYYCKLLYILEGGYCSKLITQCTVQCLYALLNIQDVDCSNNCITDEDDGVFETTGIDDIIIHIKSCFNIDS